MTLLRRPSLQSRMFLVSAAAVVFLLGAAGQALAQSECEVQLRAADESYLSGRFDEVQRLAEACLDGRPSREEKRLAYTILAKTYLAQDSLELARQTVEELVRLDPEFEPDRLRDPARFVRMVDEVKAASTTVLVTGVSKSAESLREAPGTVVVITAEEIERRGYTNLEELFHDLPGFDISRSNGVTYSTLYQRGYRSDLTQRTILLIDGVEENDLWIQAAWISRQYPLSNIDRIEVVYGPASTIYGANAFAGVVNVITKNPEQVIDKGKTFGFRADVGGGSWDTRMADVTVAGRTANGNLAWSLTGRGYRSDEWDLSGYPEWDYDLAAYDWSYDILRRTSYYSRLSVLSGAQAVLDANPGMPLDSPLYTIVRDDAGVAQQILLTEAGAQRAFELDLAGYSQLGGRPMEFSDPTDDWAVSGKLRVYGLQLGFQVWRREEGWTPSHHDMFAPGGDNGFIWTPMQTWLYAKYSRDLTQNLTFNFFARYKKHEIDQPTVGHNFIGYSSSIPAYTIATLAAGVPSVWSRTYFHSQSSQLRTELSAVYNPSEKLDVVAGFEARFGDIQGTYVWGPDPNPAETGSPRWAIPGGNRFSTRDLGLYAQASYRPWQRWKFVLGGRLDNNQVRTTLGYGTVFNPRLGVVYSPGTMTFKAIYSEAFQEVSNFQQYVIPVENAGQLEPEKVKNTELSASWQPTKELSLDLTAYDASYSNVAQLVSVAGQREFQQIGALQIRGIQATGSYRFGSYTVVGNYTFTHPYNTDPRDAVGNPLSVSELRVTDIASHHLNLGLTAELWERWTFDVRGNYVSDRDQGMDTTALLFGGTLNYPVIDSYAVANAAVTYKGPTFGTDLQTKLQLVVDNLFDTEYFDPGPRDKDPVYTGRSPQPGRFIMLRAIFTY